MDLWYLLKEDLGVRLRKTANLSVPSAAFCKESENIAAIFWFLRKIVLGFIIDDLKVKVNLVN